jgi:hypothetical protein
MTTITELPARLAAHRITHGQGEIIKGSFTIRLMTIRGRWYSIMYRTWDYGRG